MRHLSGQAARWVARLLHAALSLALLAALLAAAGASVLGWRLSKGPLELPWLVGRIEQQANAEDSTTRLSIGSAALAWEGFSQGVDRPLDLRVTDVAVTDTAGARLLSVPQAEVSLSLLGLLLGRIEPRAIAIEHARLRLYRSATGEIGLDVAALPEAGGTAGAAEETAEPAGPTGRARAGLVAALLREFSRPAGTDLSAEHRRFRQLRRVRIVDAALVVVDRQLQATWRAPRAEIDLLRGAAGGVHGRADLTVTLGDQTAQVNLVAELAPGGAETHLRASMTPVAPAALARAAAPLAPLTALNAPVGVVATADLGPALGLERARATVQVGAGEVHVGSAAVPLSEATVVLAGDPQGVSLESARLALLGHPGGPPTVLAAHGTLRRETARIHADLSVALDQVSFADLPALWPQGIAPGARSWITENIPAGTARDGKVDVALDVAPDFSDATLTAAHGTLVGDGLTVWWLRPVPPIEQGVAQLRILDPDTLEIAVQSGRQRADAAKPGSGGLTVHDGTVRITGIMQHDQFGKIAANLAGPVPDVLALLRSPRLHLFDHTSVDLRNPAGQMTGKLSVSLPLADAATMDDIAVAAQARLEGVHLSGLVAGRDVDDGAVDLKADNNGMTIKGTAALATIPATVDAAFDFRAGPPAQVLQTVTVSGKPSAAQLGAIGLAPGGVFTGGSAAITATLTERRDGQGQVAASADLTAAALRLDVAGWTKAAGEAAQAEAVVRLQRDRLAGIDRIRLTAPGASVQGHASFADGRAQILQVDQFSLGKTTATGTVRFPAQPDGPIAATVTGDTIDLSARLSYDSAKEGATPTDRVSAETAAQGNPPGQAWSLDARFGRAIMANGQTFRALVLNAQDDGRRLNRLRLDARAGGGEAPVTLEIAPAGGGRRLTATAADAGGLLRALDIMKTMEGGRLSLTGTFDDRVAGDPLAGSAEIEEFRIRNAPAMARVLQAMTLYGVVDMVNGPGLGFTKLIAPFRLAGSVLELTEARAYSASLGLTAKGSIDLARNTADIQGTVVPAYFFNSLLGRVPLLGRLFSPETGGGLFAANYTVRGKLADPAVSVNPLSALTPGFLRGLFGDL